MMSGAKKRVPKRRFKEFLNAGDWEQRELAELCNVYDGTHQTPRYTNSGVMFVSVENIKTLKSDKYISEDDFKNEFKTFPEFGDILLTRIGDVGSANIILDNIKRAYYVSLALLKPKGVNSLFLLALLSSDSVQSEIWKRTLHIAFPKKINKNEISKVIVSKPSILEQKKIGELIYALDQIITLHQRKLDKLQATKKALLHEMFPEEGQDKPKRRFKGFTDAWEQRKLDDVFEIVDGDRGKNYPGTGDFLSNGDVLFLDTGNVRKDGFNFDNRRYIDFNRDKLLRNGRLILGDYVLTSRGTLGNLAYYSQSVYDRYPQVRINSAMLILRVMNTIKVNNLYLYITLRSNVINEFMKHNFVGSAQPHITKKEFSSVLLPIPRQLEEQKMIGDFFDRFEKTITLHQRKLDKLKNLKQAYLNEMFV